MLEEPKGPKRTCGYPFSRFLPRSSAPGGLNGIRKEAWLEPVPVSAYVGSSKKLKDLNMLACGAPPRVLLQLRQLSGVVGSTGIVGGGALVDLAAEK